MANPNIIRDYLKKNYFPEISMELDLNRVNSNARTDSEEQHFTESQLAFIVDIDKSMQSISSAEELYIVIDKFRIRAINNLNMSDEEKLQMLAIVEYSNSLHDYLINGGVLEFIRILPNVGNSNSNGRIFGDGDDKEYEIGCSSSPEVESDADCEAFRSGGGGCSVNWRSVWGAAVISLASNAVRGAVIADTVGSFTVPVLGTATGAVGGAVFGGAARFVGGAIGGIATELLLSCGR